MKIRIILKKMSYQNSNHVRILNSCLKTWFENPKDLQLTDPRMSFPFRFNQWVKTSYTHENTETWGAYSENWMVGMISMRWIPDQNYVHLFHLFVDKLNRNSGVGNKLMNAVETHAKKIRASKITLNVIPRNFSAIKLYENCGFILVKSTKNHLKMEKHLH